MLHKYQRCIFTWILRKYVAISFTSLSLWRYWTEVNTRVCVSHPPCDAEAHCVKKWCSWQWNHACTDDVQLHFFSTDALPNPASATPIQMKISIRWLQYEFRNFRRNFQPLNRKTNQVSFVVSALTQATFCFAVADTLTSVRNHSGEQLQSCDMPTPRVYSLDLFQLWQFGFGAVAVWCLCSYVLMKRRLITQHSVTPLRCVLLWLELWPWSSMQA